MFRHRAELTLLGFNHSSAIYQLCNLNPLRKYDYSYSDPERAEAGTYT